jgi:fucose 4-O-acetylase-like acetyltransferase
MGASDTTITHIPSSESRLLFVDNLRIALSILVVLHHIALVYGAASPFYYMEPPPIGLSTYKVFLVFVLFNQAFFMGFFFLISGYFVPRSYDRRGSVSYLKWRLLRLGIPLILFIFVLGPISSLGEYQMPTSLSGITTPLTWQLYPQLIEVGPLWFIEMLLIFDFGYTLWRIISKNRKARPLDDRKPPRYLAIGIFTLALATVSYLLRMVVPMGKTLPILRYQVLQFPTLAYLPQYLSFFIIGIIASRRDWFRAIPVSMGYVGFGMALVAAVVLFPLALSGHMFSLKLSVVSGNFVGNGWWHSAVYALWDSIFSVGMCLGLITLFRRFLNQQGKLSRVMSQQSFAVFILHIPIVVFVAVLIRGINLQNLLKFCLAAILIVPLCFAVAWLVRKIPGVSKIV